MLNIKSQYDFLILLLQSVMLPSSSQAVKINRLFHYFNIAALSILLLICFLVIYICLKFRAKTNVVKAPSYVYGNNTLEAFMIGGPAVLLAWFFYQTVVVIHDVAPKVDHRRKPDVIITGHQWWWEIAYPGYKITTANEIHLPVGRSLLMEMRSADVIHDWWVPQLGNKIDLVPNINNYLSLDINDAGEYLGACSEFCGAEHAWMRIKVIAQQDSDFKRWITENIPDAPPPVDSIASIGAGLFQAKTCASCHRIRGTQAVGTSGPDLTHLQSRAQLLTGILENNAKSLMEWISHPQKIKPGAHMPDFIFNKDSVQAIVHYLSQLK